MYYVGNSWLYKYPIAVYSSKPVLNLDLIVNPNVHALTCRFIFLSSYTLTFGACVVYICNWALMIPGVQFGVYFNIAEQVQLHYKCICAF